MEEEVKSAENTARHARQAEKEARAARDAAIAAENGAIVTESAQQGLEVTLRWVQDELAAARVEHARFMDVALPAALEEART